MKKWVAVLIYSMLLCSLSALAWAEGSTSSFDLKEVELGVLNEGGLETFEIELTNITNASLNIEGVDTTCGCTLAEAPQGPIKPGETAKVKVTIDTRGKVGDISKMLTIKTSSGLMQSSSHEVLLKASVGHGEGIVDPSVIFAGDCASCHVGINVEKKKGEMLYNSICSLCHKGGIDAEAANSQRLVAVIGQGIDDSSMPGFLESERGPITPEQVDSLVTYIRKRFGGV